MKANPGDGVWFIGPANPDGTGPPADYLIVCSHRDGSGAGALLFTRPVRTVPDDLSTRNQADQWFGECMRWLRRCLTGPHAKDSEKWPPAPVGFLMFLSAKPGKIDAFIYRDADMTSELTSAAYRVALALGEIWPEWKEWRSQMDKDPELMKAVWLEDTGVN